MPKQIGRYQILDRLATGGMAELFKATLTGEHGFEKLVVIKKILPHLAKDKSFVEMFIDEARITAQLDHRHIVQVFELDYDAGTPFIAMQYVDGLDVLALLRECARAQIRLPAELAALIARDVLDALDYAHNAIAADGKPLRVIHRDISPGNVLLSWRGDVKLTDFGIARAAERRHKTETGTLKCKYGYMSPEQISGGEVDPRSDLFSAGILLAEMVMARRLFTSTNDLDILLMVRDVLELLLTLSNVPITIESDPARVRPNDLPFFVGDAGLAQRLLGWKPKRIFRETVKSVLTYCRQNVARGP
jgi:serine/threonine-protein kinase